jgi:hypothetical protein
VGLTRCQPDLKEPQMATLIHVDGDQLVREVLANETRACLDRQTGQIVPLDEVPPRQRGEGRGGVKHRKRFVVLPCLDEAVLEIGWSIGAYDKRRRVVDQAAHLRAAAIAACRWLLSLHLAADVLVEYTAGPPMRISRRAAATPVAPGTIRARVRRQPRSAKQGRPWTLAGMSKSDVRPFESFVDQWIYMGRNWSEERVRMILWKVRRHNLLRLFILALVGQHGARHAQQRPAEWRGWTKRRLIQSLLVGGSQEFASTLRSGLLRARLERFDVEDASLVSPD